MTALVVLMSCLALVFGIYLIGDGSEGFRWEAVGYGIPRVIFSFFLGVLMFRFHGQVSRMPRAMFLGPPLLLLAALSIDPGDQRALFNAVFIVVLSPVLLLWAYQSEVPPRWRFLASYLGRISFCVYSIHLPQLNMAKGAHRVIGVDLGLMVAFVVLALLALSPRIVSWFDVPLRRTMRSRLGIDTTGSAKV